MEDNEQNNPIPDIRKIWKNMIQDLSTQNPALSQLLKETNIHTANHNTIQLNIRFAFHAEKIKEKKTQNIIQKILKDKTGRNWIIQYNINKATPRPTTHKAIQSPQNKNKTASTQENNDIAQEVSTVFSISA